MLYLSKNGPNLFNVVMFDYGIALFFIAKLHECILSLTSVGSSYRYCYYISLIRLAKVIHLYCIQNFQKQMQYQKALIHSNEWFSFVLLIFITEIKVIVLIILVSFDTIFKLRYLLLLISEVLLAFILIILSNIFLWSMFCKGNRLDLFIYLSILR